MNNITMPSQEARNNFRKTDCRHGENCKYAKGEVKKEGKIIPCSYKHPAAHILCKFGEKCNKGDECEYKHPQRPLTRRSKKPSSSLDEKIKEAKLRKILAEAEMFEANARAASANAQMLEANASGYSDNASDTGSTSGMSIQERIQAMGLN